MVSWLSIYLQYIQYFTHFDRLAVQILTNISSFIDGDTSELLQGVLNASNVNKKEILYYMKKLNRNALMHLTKCRRRMCSF